MKSWLSSFSAKSLQPNPRANSFTSPLLSSPSGKTKSCNCSCLSRDRKYDWSLPASFPRRNCQRPLASSNCTRA